MKFYMHDVDGTIITLFKTLDNALNKYNKEDHRESVSLITLENNDCTKTVLFSWKYEKRIFNMQDYSRIEKLRSKSTNILYGLFTENDRFDTTSEFWVQHMFFTNEDQRLIYCLALTDIDPHWFTIEIDNEIDILTQTMLNDDIDIKPKVLLITEK